MFRCWQNTPELISTSSILSDFLIHISSLTVFPFLSNWESCHFLRLQFSLFILSYPLPTTAFIIFLTATFCFCLFLSLFYPPHLFFFHLLLLKNHCYFQRPMMGKDYWISVPYTLNVFYIKITNFIKYSRSSGPIHFAIRNEKNIDI